MENPESQLKELAILALSLDAMKREKAAATKEWNERIQGMEERVAEVCRDRPGPGQSARLIR